MNIKPSNRLRIASVLLILAMILFTNSRVQAVGIKIGLVTDEYGVADMGYSYMAYQGLLEAETDLGVDGTLYEPASPSNYAASLQQCATDGNELCFAVGFTMTDAVVAAANANPGTAFAILDAWLASPPANLRLISFNEKEAGYLAGALAGKMTSSDVVGVVGGMAGIPAVVSFVEGYRNGTQCSNPNATVLADYTGTFVDSSLGAGIAQQMINDNADVIFSAAGPTGNGAILHSAENGVWSIGVDTDQYVSLFGNGTVTGSDKVLSSAMKRLDNAIYRSIDDYVGGGFTFDLVTYNLADGGVGLAPYHETDSSIPQATKDYVNSVTADIISGSLDINQTCRTTPKVGLVTDANGTSDMSFNWMAAQGLWQAQTDLDVMGTVYESPSGNNYAGLLQQCVNDGNELCFAVGFMMTDAIVAAANANPGTAFAIVDAWLDTSPANLRGILFDEKQAGYLAGTLAGKMSASGTIGVVAGMEQVPAVVRFVEGYRNGAQCAADSNVLINYTGTFTDPALGASVAADMISNGADVIFSAAGPTGNGAILYSAQNGVWSIGVDSDQYVSLFGSGSVSGSNKVLSSALKKVDGTVHVTIEDYLNNVFTSGNRIYDLALDGVGLAPYHEADASIPQEVKDYLAAVKQGILNHTININASCQTISLPSIPILLSPSNGILLNTLQPTLDWKDSTPYLPRYQLQVSKYNTFTSLVLDETDLLYSNFAITSDLDPGTRYFWRVRAFNLMDGTKGWSTIWNFKTPLTKPVLDSPLCSSSLLTDRPDFNWQDVNGATKYLLQVSPSSSFGTLLVNATINESEYSQLKDLPQNKTLYWRVKAMTSVVSSPWSDKCSFITGNPPNVPALVAPANNTLVKDYTPKLDWSNSTLPVGTTFKRYELQVDDNNDFSTPEIEISTTEGLITESYFTPLTDLMSNAKYFWRVRAVNLVGADEHVSGWSAVRAFRTVILPPTLLLPVNLSTETSLKPLFDWENVDGATSYTIQISTSSGFGTFLVNLKRTVSDFTPTTNLPKNKTVYWRVRANGPNGPSAWSTFQFTTPP